MAGIIAGERRGAAPGRPWYTAADDLQSRLKGGGMRLSEDKIRRIAERLHDELAQRGLLEYREAPGNKAGAGRAARVKVIYEFIVTDLRQEEEIDAEVEKILASYSREIKGTERDILFRKHKEDIARKKGYML
jgi:hypothetical protein